MINPSQPIPASKGYRQTLLVAAFVAIASLMNLLADDKHAVLRPFTIKDSIEISYIVSPTAYSTAAELRDSIPVGAPIVSPDRKRFLLITQRGILRTNMLEASIWMFESNTVIDYCSGTSEMRPSPQLVARVAATSNVPVVTDLRWLANSKRVSFLARDANSRPQLFIVDLKRSMKKKQITHGEYVVAYDMEGSTIAYTTLTLPPRTRPASFGESEHSLVTVTGRSIWPLLFPEKDRSAQDVDESILAVAPTILHVIRNGHNAKVAYSLNGRPLQLFRPVFRISPDEQSLIAVAPIERIPDSWTRYRSAGYEAQLRPNDPWSVATENWNKAEQFVLVDLRNGLSLPLVNAPAGRGLNYMAPTKVFWFDNGRQAILSNTFLPTDTSEGESRESRYQAPAVAVVDTDRRTIIPLVFVKQPPFEDDNWYRIEDITWDKAKKEIMLTYSADGHDVRVPRPEVYKLTGDRWSQLPEPGLRTDSEILKLTVVESLDQPPTLYGQLDHGEPAKEIWDPNPQLESISLGKTSLYKWKDKNGNELEGILSLPPGYDLTVRYPMVIQTHGYDATRFFADGQFTTGSGGRALTARGIIVLQLRGHPAASYTALEGPDQVSGFEGAIEQLAARGMIDPRRVGIIGFSRTCFDVLFAITHSPDLFAAASITDGVNFSYANYLLSIDNEASFGLEKISETVNGGAPPFGKGLLNWAASAPGFNLDSAKTPLLISALETGQLLLQWENYAGLRRMRRPVDMVWLRAENAPHILVQPFHRYMSQQLAVDWFSFWLKDEEDSDPNKKGQFLRWRELRKLRDENRSPVVSDR